jgi:23S rRNA pseudouridine2605 synthase
VSGTATAERLNRYLARRGVSSRRGADALIASGRVTVNGEPGSLGAVVVPERDRVLVDGHGVVDPGAAVVLALHKPVGVATTRHDPQGRHTVMELVEPVPGLVPVGRLDIDSRGLLLLTNDGQLAHRVAHPRYAVRKRYRVTVSDRPSAGQLQRLRDGVTLADGFARALDVHAHAGGNVVTLAMEEGRRREVRRLCAAVGLEVTDLLRTAIGPIALGSLPAGTARALTAGEERQLRSAVGLETDAPE